MRCTAAAILLALVADGARAAGLSGCASCSLTLGALGRAREETAPAVAPGASMCDAAPEAVRAPCHSLVGHYGDEAVARAAARGQQGAPGMCAETGICGGDVLVDDADELWSLADGGLQADEEDTENEKAHVETHKVAETGSRLQSDNAADAEARRRAEVAQAKREGDEKVAAALKTATAQFRNATHSAVAVAKAKAVAAAKAKWERSWRTRKWPTNVSVPKKASKLPCTEGSLGRMAFRENSFYGCKTHCVQECKQCNCREEEKVVEDADCKCFKRVKKEVCDSCCTNKCGPEWIAFAECARTCEECDCKVEHGIKVCQSCCKEKCGPKWHKGPI